MDVGSATDGNSGAGGVGDSGGVGDGGGVGSGNDNGSTAGVDSSNASSDVSNTGTDNSSAVSTDDNDTSIETTKDPNESIETTHASKTGMAAAVAKASVEESFAKQAEIDDRQFDGHFVGSNGQTYSPDTPLSEIDAVMPANGITNDRTVVQVNGINTDVASQAASLQAIADQTGSRVIGVHNSTAGTIRDLAQSLGDKLDIGNNPAVTTLADTIMSELKAGREVDLMAHSQGAIITSRALTDVRNQLQLEDGLTRQQAENLLSNVDVETFGGASRRYPDGPNYVHYVNRNDAVPQLFGLREFFNPFAQRGEDAVMNYFREGNFGVGEAHAFSTYLGQRVPFEQARQGN